MAQRKYFLHENVFQVVVGIHFNSLLDKNYVSLSNRDHIGPDHGRNGMVRSRDVAATLNGLVDRYQILSFWCSKDYSFLNNFSPVNRISEVSTCLNHLISSWHLSPSSGPSQRESSAASSAAAAAFTNRTSGDIQLVLNFSETPLLVINELVLDASHVDGKGRD